MENDILQEIPDEHLPLLSNLYKSYQNEAPHVYSLINTSIAWKAKRPNSNYLTFLGVDNDWLETGTFILFMQYECYDFFVYTLEDDCKGLFKAFTQTKRIDWTKRMMWYSVASKHTPAIIDVLKELRVPMYICADTELWVVEREKALQFEIECPEEVYVGKLDVSHADLVNFHWPHRHEGAEKYLAKLIEMNNSIGLFLKSDDSLVCWVMKSPMGQMCNLQTLPEHKRKGYAMLVTKLMAKEIAKEGYNPLGTIVRSNKASESMFSKLGFRSIDICSYIIINT